MPHTEGRFCVNIQGMYVVLCILTDTSKRQRELMTGQFSSIGKLELMNVKGSVLYVNVCILMCVYLVQCVAYLQYLIILNLPIIS